MESNKSSLKPSRFWQALVLSMSFTQAAYKIENCYECSRELDYNKICNLGNNSPSITPIATNPYMGACCTKDDESQFCMNEKDGGYKGNYCSPDSGTWAIPPPLWFSACPIPERSKCGNSKFNPTETTKKYENSGLMVYDL